MEKTLLSTKHQGNRMSRDYRIAIIIVIGLIAICAVLAYQWFHENYAYKDVEETTGYSAEARRNKFLAAEYYLRELNFKVESDSNRARLLEPHSPDQTILINSYGPKLSPTHFSELNQWLEAGGHLIFTATNFRYEPDDDDDEDINDEYDEDEYYEYEYKNNQLLEKYGIQARYTNFTDNLSYPEEDEVTEFILENGNLIKLNFAPDTHLIDLNKKATFSIADRYGIHLLQMNIGKGKLTVLSDNQLFNNYNIGEYDHAYLLWLLSSTTKSVNNKMLLLYNNESDSIFTLLWRYGKEACIAFFAFLLLGLWSLQNRFGPILPDVNFSNRNIVEHLRAIARFSWRQDHGAQLLQQSRAECENALLNRYPALKEISSNERIQLLSDILDMEPEVIHSALYFEPNSTNEYINSSHYLQKIWILQ